jgi:hypothetical protein
VKINSSSKCFGEKLEICYVPYNNLKVYSYGDNCGEPSPVVTSPLLKSIKKCQLYLLRDGGAKFLLSFQKRIHLYGNGLFLSVKFKIFHVTVRIKMDSTNL